MTRWHFGVMIFGLLYVLLPTHASWAIDPVLQDAQRKLNTLGYDPGMADGVYGPRTRQALEAFQREQHLPVSGLLDTATLQALDRETMPQDGTEHRAVPEPPSPLQAVLSYLRFFPFQPARVLPLVTESFRGGRSPAEWVEQTSRLLASQDYTYLGWQVQHVEATDTQATIEVQTRVRVNQEEQQRQEVFALRRNASGDWLIDTWRIEALTTSPASTRMGS